MTTTEQLILPAWAAGADRFSLAPGAEPHLCDVDYPIAGTPGTTTEPERDLTNAEMPTVLLPISPLAGFGRLRPDIRDDFRQLLDELDDYLEVLGVAATEQPIVHEQPILEKRRRWHRLNPAKESNR